MALSAHARVADAMRPGVLTCPPETPLVEVARIMSTNRVHAVVVSYPIERGKPAEWGVVTALDLVGRLAGGDFGEETAGDIAAAAPVTTRTDGTLQQAAQLMAEHGATHLIVLATESGRPAGVLSTLDLVGLAASAS